jgi:hypothetical protein
MKDSQRTQHLTPARTPRELRGVHTADDLAKQDRVRAYWAGMERMDKPAIYEPAPSSVRHHIARVSLRYRKAAMGSWF